MATRLYFPNTSGGTPTPAPTPSTEWDYLNPNMSSFRAHALVVPVGADLGTTSFFIGPGSTDVGFMGFLQQITGPISAQTINAQTVKLQIQGSASAGTNYLAWGARVLSSDGSTVRGTLVPVHADNTALTSTLTNRGDSVTCSQVVAHAGDIIVIELGFQRPSTGNMTLSLRRGDNAVSDLPENDSETDQTLKPWIEFAENIRGLVDVGPEITDVDPDTLAHGDTFTVTGSGFGATQGSGAVVISPTDDVEDGDAVSITNVGTWADDELTDVVFDQGGINPGSAYLFVVNDDGDANEDGIPITIVPVEIEVSDTLSVAVGNAAQAADTITASDTLSVALTEAMAIVEALTAEDTLSVAITEGESTLLDFEVIEVSDTLSLALEETAEAVVTIEHFSVTDTLSLAVTDEAATAFDAITASDSLVVVVSDASQAAELLTATDTLVVVLTEGAATFLEAIHVTDTLSLAITDAIQAADTIALVDTLSLALQDSSVAMELWTASDTLSLALTESSSVRILPVYHVPSRLINDPPRAAHRPVRPSVQAEHTPSRLEEDA